MEKRRAHVLTTPTMTCPSAGITDPDIAPSTLSKIENEVLFIMLWENAPVNSYHIRILYEQYQQANGEILKRNIKIPSYNAIRSAMQNLMFLEFIEERPSLNKGAFSWIVNPKFRKTYNSKKAVYTKIYTLSSTSLLDVLPAHNLIIFYGFRFVNSKAKQLSDIRLFVMDKIIAFSSSP